MRSNVTRLIFLLLGFCLLNPTAGAIDVGFSVDTQKLLGHTTYQIKFSEYIPEIESDVKGESELEFPLDVFLVGASMTFKGEFKTGEPWGLNLGISKNVNDPSGYMKDTDWIQLPKYNIHTKFSFTESDAKLEALILYVEGRFGLVKRPNFVLELLGGYQFRDFSFEIFGVRGWQGIEWQNMHRFDTLQAVNVGDYDVTYHIPYGGMGAYLQFSPRVGWEVKCAVSPNVSVSDHDDHILRHKTADGDCSGWALKAGTDLRWIVFKTSNKSNWFLGLGFDFLKIDTNG